MTLPAIKKPYPKVVTFPFAGDLVIKKLKFLNVFQDKYRCFFFFFFKNEHLYHERLLIRKFFLAI